MPDRRTSRRLLRGRARRAHLVACSLAAGLLGCLAFGTASASGPLAELVAITTSDKVLLHGLHYRPAQPSRRAVIHVPGGPGAFYSAQDMAPLAAALTRAGWHFLSVNMRTAGANGMLWARFDDYRHDIAAAVQRARAEGAAEIVLLGHSLGSARVLHYLARTQEPLVRALVLSGVIASPYLEAQLRWDAAQRARYDAFLAQQRERVRAGRGAELAAYPWAGERELVLSASTWVDVFGRPEESDASTVEFAANVRVPVLLIHATRDEAALPANAQQLLAALSGTKDKQLIEVEGANHLFIGFAERYAEIVTRWLDEHLGAAQSKTDVISSEQS